MQSAVASGNVGCFRQILGRASSGMQTNPKHVGCAVQPQALPARAGGEGGCGVAGAATASVQCEHPFLGTDAAGSLRQAQAGACWRAAVRCCPSLYCMPSSPQSPHGTAAGPVHRPGSTTALFVIGRGTTSLSAAPQRSLVVWLQVWRVNRHPCQEPWMRNRRGHAGGTSFGQQQLQASNHLLVR